jgi:ABC-2 type transport system permease protein
MNIFLRELRTGRRSLLVWATVIAGLNVLIMAVYPSFAADAARLEEFIALYPEAFAKAFGLDRLNVADPVGFYAMEGYAIVVLFGGIYAAILGASILAKEEDEKTIEYLLALPVTRCQVLTGKVLAVVANLALFNLIVAAVTYLGFVAFVTRDYSASTLVLLFTAPFLAHLTFAALCLLLSLFWTRRRAAYSVSIGLVVGTYFLNVIALLTDDFRWLGWLSPFKYVDAADIVAGQSLDGLYVFILLAAAVLAVGATYLLYTRRDITV